MRTVDISEAADSLPDYGRRKRGETWVLTRRGRPVAAVVPLDDEDFFSMRLANNPKFIKLIENARAQAETEGTIPLADIEREFGIKPLRKRRVSSKDKRKAG